MARMRLKLAFAALIGLLCLGDGPGWTTASVLATMDDDRDGWRDLRAIPDPPGAQQEHAVVVLNRKIYVLGGVEAVPQANSCFPAFPIPYCSSRDVDVYDVATGRWSAAS